MPLQQLMWVLLAPMRRSRKETATSIRPTASTRAYVGQQACLVCGRKQSDPHHLRYLQPRALGRKVSDEFAVPLCRSHHRAVHRAADEQAWWKAAGIDPVKVARQLWGQTRLDNPQDRRQPGLAAHPKTRSSASASDGTRGSQSDQAVIGRADDGRTP
jgi:hypothetical protein